MGVDVPEATAAYSGPSCQVVAIFSRGMLQSFYSSRDKQLCLSMLENSQTDESYEEIR